MLTDGHPKLTTADYFDGFATALGLPATRKVPTVAMTAAAWAMHHGARLSKRPNLVDPDAVAYLCRTGTYSNAKARSMLGWEPKVSPRGRPAARGRVGEGGGDRLAWIVLDLLDRRPSFAADHRELGDVEARIAHRRLAPRLPRDHRRPPCLVLRGAGARSAAREVGCRADAALAARRISLPLTAGPRMGRAYGLASPDARACAADVGTRRLPCARARALRRRRGESDTQAAAEDPTARASRPRGGRAAVEEAEAEAEVPEDGQRAVKVAEDAQGRQAA